MASNGVEINGIANGEAKANEEAKIDREPNTQVDSGRIESRNGDWSVEGIVAQLPSGVPETDSTSPVPFFHMLERLKTTKREGWRRFGIDKGESISDHMYRMSLITMFAPASLSSKLDIPRCTKMALIHDMAEALVGDITPVDGVPKHEKNRRESTTMDYFCKSLLGRVNGGVTGEDIKAIWQEYEDSETPESKFVHDIDKVELVLQMFEYERAHKRKLDLGEFSWVATRIVLPECKEWADAILKEREEFWGEVEHATYSAEKTEEDKIFAQKMEYYSGGPSPAPLDSLVSVHESTRDVEG